MRLLAPLLLALLLLPVPVSSSSPPGVTDPGPFGVVTAPYDLGVARVGPGDGWLLPLQGEAYVPADASGPRPVLVVIHGASAATALSHKGYAYFGANLASHGIVVLSMNVAPLDAPGAPWREGRVDALNATLDELARDASRLPLPPGASLDLANVGVAGHSRGGLAVLDAGLHDPLDAHRRGLRAVLAIAPVTGGSVPRLPLLVLLPYCDQPSGMAAFERSIHAPDADGEKMQVVAMGANHNWYNAYWLNDDAGHLDDAACRSPLPDPAPNARLLPEDQRRHGLALVGAFFRMTLLGDDAGRAWLEARAPAPPGACPAGAAACPGRIRVTHEPDEDHRTLVELGDGGAGNHFDGFTGTACAAPPAGTPTLRQCLAWSRPATWTMDLPDVDARGHATLRFRAANHGTAARGVEVGLVDANDTVAWVALQPVALEPAHGTASRKAFMHDVRVPLDAFPGVDLSKVRHVKLRLGADGAGAADVSGVLFH